MVSTWAFGKGEVLSASIGSHAREAGVARIRTPLCVGDLVSRLSGWMNDPSLPPGAMWPPPFETLGTTKTDSEGIGYAVRELGLSSEAYERICGLTRELCENEEFREAVDLVARGLLLAPHLDRESLEILRAETAFADESEPEEVPV